MPETAVTNTINEQNFFFPTTTTITTTHIRSVTSATNNHPRPPSEPTTTTAYGNDDDYIATRSHTLPMTKRTTTIRHGSQTTVSMHERKQARRNRGGAHLASPLTSLIQNPGATSLWATWQPNDGRRPTVVVRRCCIFYNSMVSTHPIDLLHSTPPPTTTAHRTTPNNTGNVATPSHQG